MDCTRDRCGGSPGQGHCRQRRALAHAGEDRREVVRIASFALDLAAEPFRIEGWLMALLIEFIEAMQIGGRVDLRNQRTRLRDFARGRVIGGRESVSIGKIDDETARRILRSEDFYLPIAPTIEGISGPRPRAANDHGKCDCKARSAHAADDPSDDSGDGRRADRRITPLARVATSARVMKGPIAPEAARYRGSHTGRNLFLKLRSPWKL